MGDWSDVALAQVGHEFTSLIDVGDAEYNAPTDPTATAVLRGGVVPRAAGACLRA